MRLSGTETIEETELPNLTRPVLNYMSHVLLGSLSLDSRPWASEPIYDSAAQDSLDASFRVTSARALEPKSISMQGISPTNRPIHLVALSFSVPEPSGGPEGAGRQIYFVVPAHFRRARISRDRPLMQQPSPRPRRAEEPENATHKRIHCSTERVSYVIFQRSRFSVSLISKFPTSLSAAF